MSQEQKDTISGSVFDVYTEDSQEYRENRMPRVGQTVEFEDGRKFVFCGTAYDIAQGALVASPAVYTTVTTGVALKGATKVVITEPSLPANQLRNGYLFVAGQSHKIKSNSVASPVDDSVIVTLYDPLEAEIADATAGLGAFFRPDFVSEAVANGDIVGVAPLAIQAGTLGVKHFFWVQYAGMGSIKTVVADAGVTLMADAAASGVVHTAGNVCVGYTIFDAVDGAALCMIECSGGC